MRSQREDPYTGKANDDFDDGTTNEYEDKDGFVIEVLGIYDGDLDELFLTSEDAIEDVLVRDITDEEREQLKDLVWDLDGDGDGNADDDRVTWPGA